MPACAVVVCKNRSDHKLEGVTFHRFPNENTVKEKWINATGRGPDWWPTKQSTICSSHFDEKNYKPHTKIRRLFEWAVPTLKLRLIFATADTNTSQNLQRSPAINAIDSEPQRSENTSIPQPSQGLADLYRNFLGNDDDDDDRQSSLADDEDDTPKQTTSTNPQLTHDQIHCDHCNNEIKGFRYKCLQCEDFDLCQACEAAGMHCDHYMLRIPKPRPEQEVAALLQTLRAHLPESVESEQTVPEVHDQAGPSHQKSNIKSAKKTKPVNVTNQTTQNKSDTQETNASSSEPHIDYLNYPIKTEIESEVLVDSQSTNLEYFDPLKTEPTSSVTDTPLLSFVVPNTYSIPLIVSSTPHLQIDPTSMTICSVDTNTVKIEPSEIEPSEVAGTDSITVFSHSKTKPKQTSTTNTGSSGTSKPPAKKRMKPN